MLGNTVVLTIGGVAKTLTLVNTGTDYTGEYYLREATQEFRFKVRHSKVNGAGQAPADRHNAELVRTVFATTTTPEYVDKAYFVFQASPGRTAVDMMSAIAVWGTATSNANLTKLEGWES
jgi:hypothetical protein